VANNSETDLRIAVAKQAVMAETALMHDQFGHATPVIKHDGTKVTPVDIAISEHIQAALLRQFPGDQFFSEELVFTDVPVPLTSRYSWVLDPIDGTNNYAKGIIYCAISLALLEHGTPVYGVIYDMARRLLIHGGPGRGVWDGDKPAHARAGGPDGQSMVGFHSPVDKGHAEGGKEAPREFQDPRPWQQHAAPGLCRHRPARRRRGSQQQGLGHCRRRRAAHGGRRGNPLP
jgi:myo-inositol-1(or 4)-monophosphatase